MKTNPPDQLLFFEPEDLELISTKLVYRIQEALYGIHYQQNYPHFFHTTHLKKTFIHIS